MNICLIQTDPQLKQDNLNAIVPMIQRSEADLYVLPELFTIGFDAAAETAHQTAEPFPSGPTCQSFLQLLKNRRAVVVCGMLERADSGLFNIAAVIGAGWADRYRQKNPASTTQGWVLPVRPGEYRKIPIPLGWSLGLMVCNDHFAAAEFFAEYKKRGVDSVVLIADSASRAWIREFPAHCKKHGLIAIVCNAAGPNGGASCVIDRNGQFVRLRTSTNEYEWLPDAPMYAVGTM